MIKPDQRVYLNQTFDTEDFNQQVITEKEFDNCTFKNCNFTEAQLKKCKLIECTFSLCNLSNLHVNQSSFNDVFFEECKMVGINWTKAHWPIIKLSCPLRFNKCILNDSTFLGLSLREMLMTECKAHDVDFREADCFEANFSYTDFTHSLFNKTNLKKADFSESLNYQINVFENDVKGAKFSLPEAVNLLRGLEIEIND